LPDQGWALDKDADDTAYGAALERYFLVTNLAQAAAIRQAFIAQHFSAERDNKTYREGAGLSLMPAHG
jgi:hypothetical protein